MPRQVPDDSSSEEHLTGGRQRQGLAQLLKRHGGLLGVVRPPRAPAEPGSTGAASHGHASCSAHSRARGCAAVRVRRRGEHPARPVRPHPPDRQPGRRPWRRGSPTHRCTRASAGRRTGFASRSRSCSSPVKLATAAGRSPPTSAARRSGRTEAPSCGRCGAATPSGVVNQRTQAGFDPDAHLPDVAVFTGSTQPARRALDCTG